MDGPAIISFRWDNILAVAVIVIGLVLLVTVPAQIYHHVQTNQGQGQ